MWQTFKAWCYKNRFFFLLLGVCALAVAIGLPLACYFSPAVFAALISVAPLAFLATIPLPAALTLVGVMGFAAVLAGVTLARVLLTQAYSILAHMYPLFFQTETREIDPPEYQPQHLDTAIQPVRRPDSLPGIDPLSKPRFFFEVGANSNDSPTNTSPQLETINTM